MNYTRYVSVKFLTELLVITAIYVFPFERRSKYWLKLPLCLAVCYAFSYFTSPVLLGFHTWAEPAASLISISRYMCILALVVLSVYFLLDVGIREAFFACAGSYAIQHLVLKAYGFVEGFYLDAAPLYLTAALYIFFLVLSYTAAYFIIIRRLQREDAARLKANDAFTFNLLIVFGLIVLSVFSDDLEAASTRGEFALVGYGAICSVFLLTLQLNIFQKSSMERENEEIEQILA